MSKNQAMTPNAVSLSLRIRQWQNDDKAGYDQAIAVLCGAADVLARLQPEGETEDWKRRALEAEVELMYAQSRS